jgi:acetyl esterase/lipase
VRALAWAAFRPGVSWPVGRRLVEVGLSVPPPPSSTRFTRLTIAGVPCEEVRAPGAAVGTSALLYLHGGGYVVCSPRTHRAITVAMAAAFGAPVIVPDYRLAPEHPHPAAFEDALAVWHGLNLPPGSVAVAGDSAGGSLALELALSLPDPDRPAALGLICPWLQPALDAQPTRWLVPGDVLLSPDLLHRFAAAYFDGASASAPLDADLAGLPPVIVHTASDDTIREDGERFVGLARAAGVTVTHEQMHGFWHDAHLSAGLLAEPVRGASARMAAQLATYVSR